MKTALYGLMLSALLTAGCIPKAPFVWPEESPTPAEPPRKHVSAVRADQVTPENAHDKAHDLEEELGSDEGRPN
jgi:hypothetical protein